MDKKILYVLGAIFIGAILFVTCYLIAENKLKDANLQTGDYEKKEVKDEILFKSIKKKSNKIVESFSIAMNGKRNTFNIEFTTTKNGTATEIKGTFKNESLFLKNRTNEDISKELNENDVKAFFTEQNFRFIKGTDEKTYLLVLANRDLNREKEDYLYILNDKFEILEGDMNYNGCGENNALTLRTSKAKYELLEQHATYQDQFQVCDDSSDCAINVKIEDSKIHYLKVFPKYEEFDFGNVEERIYTIADNRLNYTVENTYKIANATHESC